MYNFASDYLEGAHPQVMEALNKTNFIQTVGYGEDQYCQKAKDKIKAILENENVDIHFLVGGTQTNMIMISSALKDYQAVIAVDSGHINVHETGAVEFTGHKILTKPHQDGKMIPEMIDEIMREHPDEHMVQPKMVYISQTTEYGTYYTLEELKAIYECCQKNNLYLFIDGARLGSALVLKDAPTLQEMALYSDVFYIGGTKMGALFGECLVIINDELKTDFRYHIKQKGAMLAKGRLLGVQFNALFENDLYLEIGKHENECADILRKKRFKRGSIDFDFPESKIILDKDGRPVDIKPYDRNVATKLIEDFMLAANETVAEDYFWQEVPFLYRTHENPDPEKILKLSTFINNFGYSMHITDEIHPKELQKLLEKIAGSDEENLISRLTLRSMKKAKYTAECIGHFGLAAKYYCHFTSPIRRYPDLQIHRIIKECLHGGMSEKRKLHYDKILPDVAEQASATERRADEAERDTDKLKMVQYMSAHIGEYFDGVISGVTNWGIYVELPNTIEGMVSVNNMRGYYVFDENHYEMFNETTHQTYKLGQKVRVVVVDTNAISRTIDFMFAQDYEE